MLPDFLPADWPAPPNVIALSTTRLGGFSTSPFDTNNLGLHVGDNPDHVIANRHQLLSTLRLPNPPIWLEQTHSVLTTIVEEDDNRCADAAVTRSANNVLAVLTGDCLPILVCNKQGNEIAAIHAGWRGLVNGVVESAISKLQSKPSDLLAWIGPSICQSCYEVGDDVLTMYQQHYPFSTESFSKHGTKWLADIPNIAAQILRSRGVTSIYQSNACTFEGENEFYSYRRDGQTGRIASLIWFHHTNRG